MRGRTLDLLVIIAFLLVPCLSFAQAWAGKGRAEGLVKDEAGNPIEGATVTLRLPTAGNQGPDPLTTNKKGRWGYLGLDGGVWTVVIEAKGYMPSQGQLQVNPFAAAPPVTTVMKVSATSNIDTGDEMMAAGDYAGARAGYEKAMPALNEEGQARLRARIGETYVREGNYAAARGEFETAMTAIPPEEQAAVLIQIGNTYQLEENYSAARTEYEKAIPLLSPEGQAQVLVTVAQGYGLEGGKTEEAINTLMRAEEVAPGNTAVIQLLADLLMREGRDEEAAAYMAKLPEDAELPSDMVLNMGIRLYNEGNMEEALGYFERAAKEHPDEPEVYYYRGLVYLSQGRNDDAKADLKHLLEIDPDSDRKAEVEEFLSFLEQGD